MKTTLKNEFLTVIADSYGGELQSMEGADGIQYLWHGDPAYWGGRAPTLFPIVGRLRDNKATSDGGEINLPGHGFVRRSECVCEAADDTSVTYLLTASEQTKQGYPYDFAFRIRYALQGKSIKVTYTIENTDAKPLPFCVGGHPAFNVPLTEGESFEDYTIAFSKPETADCMHVDGLILDQHRFRFLTDCASFDLSHDLFREDALIFDDLQSRSVRLYSRKSGKGVQMDFDSLQYFAVWSPVKDSPFVCLEPWSGMGTCESEDDVFEHKRGMTILQPGDTAEFTYTMTIL